VRYNIPVGAAKRCLNTIPYDVDPAVGSRKRLGNHSEDSLQEFLVSVGHSRPVEDDDVISAFAWELRRECLGVNGRVYERINVESV
jgi:hypothetical protein